MTCPVCSGNTKVVDSRKHIDHIRRLRQCMKCKYTFVTIETDEDIYKRLRKKEVCDNDKEN